MRRWFKITVAILATGFLMGLGSGEPPPTIPSSPATTTDKGIPRWSGTGAALNNSEWVAEDDGSLHDKDGNARGATSVDLQLSRSTNSQVAGAINSCLAGGLDNGIAGAANIEWQHNDGSCIIGGRENTIDETGGIYGAYSTILGGYNNTISAAWVSGIYSAENCTVDSSGGQNTIVSSESSTITGTAGTGLIAASINGNINNGANFSFRNAIIAAQNGTISAADTSGSPNAAIIGGQRVEVGHGHSVALAGRYLKTEWHNEVAFGGAGDTQYAAKSSFMAIRRFSGSGTGAIVAMGGALTLADDTVYLYEAHIVGRNSNNDSSGYILRGVIKRGVGVTSTTLVGTQDKTTLAAEDATMDVNVVANTSTGSLEFQGTNSTLGGVATRWYGTVQLTRMQY